MAVLLSISDTPVTCKDYWGYLEYITSFKLNLLCNVPSSGLFTRWLPKSKRESRIQAGSLRAGPFLAGEQPLAFPPILRGFPASCLSQRQLGHPLRLAPRHAVLRVRGDRDPPPPSEANLCLSPSPPLRGCSLLRAPVSGSSRSAPQPAVLFVRLLSPGAPGFSLDQSAPRFLPEFHSVLIPSQEESGLDHA